LRKTDTEDIRRTVTAVEVIDVRPGAPALWHSGNLCEHLWRTLEEL